MSDLTYPDAGATRTGVLPEGYHHLRYRTRLTGSLERAGAAILTWRLHRAAGVRMRTDAERAAPGVRVTVGLLGLSAPCEVVWVVEEPDRIGYGYGTLPGHPESGEEAFVATREADGVWFTVTAFSRPASWFTRLGGPLTGLAQALYARRLGAVMRRLCAEARDA